VQVCTEQARQQAPRPGRAATSVSKRANAAPRLAGSLLNDFRR
jgi:hypothetical protein